MFIYIYHIYQEVCLRGIIHIHTYKSTHKCVYKSIYTYIHTILYTRMYSHTYITFLRRFARVGRDALLSGYTHRVPGFRVLDDVVCVCIYNMYTHIPMCINVCLYIYTYLYTCITIYIHVHI